MDLGAHLLALRYRADHSLAHVARVGRGEPDAEQPLDSIGGAKEVGEVAFPVSVGVDGLAEEHDLLESLCDGALHLSDQVGKRQAPLAAAGVGHHAVGAELVAAALHRDPGAHAAAAPGLEVAVGLVAIQARVGDGPMGGAPQQLGEVPVTVRADHEVEDRRMVEQARAQVLRHAARHPHHQAGAPRLEARELAQAPEHPLLGVLADRTGVDEDGVGVLGGARDRHAGSFQDTSHELAVRLVHLAAVGLEEHALHGAATIAWGPQGRPPTARRAGRDRDRGRVGPAIDKSP